MLKKGKIVGIIALILFLSVTTPASSQDEINLAVGPGFIDIGNALRNGSYQQTIYLYNQNNFNSTFLLETSGPLEEWVSFYEHTDLTKKINSTYVNRMTDRPILFRVEIPDTAANGEYIGQIMVAVQPLKEDNTDSNVSLLQLGTPVVVVINVTGDQFLSIEVERLEVQDNEVNYPARISAHFLNSGNVRAKVKTNITIINKEGSIIDRLSSSTPDIELDTLYNDVIFWETEGKIADVYTAFFEIYFNEVKIKEDNVSFELFPVGTFTRNGTLKGISYSGELKQGKLVKISGMFRNTGDVNTYAKFIAEIYKNNELVDTIESQEELVERYKDKLLNAYFEVEETGTYTLQGYVLYDGRTTETLEYKLEIESGSFFGTAQILMLFFMIFIVLVWYFFRYKRSTAFDFYDSKESNLKKISRAFKSKLSSFKIPLRKRKYNLIQKPGFATKFKTIKFKKSNKKESKVLYMSEEEAPIVAKEEKKPAILSIEKMSAKEIEEYVSKL